MWSKLKPRLKPKSKEPGIDYICKNCETQFTGHYCPECGQAVKDYDKPFSFIFYNFLGDFFAFDTRFFRTLAALVAKPGFLTNEYFDGRRVRYAPPFRIYIFVSFILFLLLQNYTNRGLTTVLDSDLKNADMKLDSTSLVLADSIINSVNAELHQNQKATADSLLRLHGIADTAENSEDLKFKINLETFRNTKDLRKLLNMYAVSLEKDLETEPDHRQRAKLREYIRLCRSPETAVAKILKNISWAFFLLLPIFAVLLKLVYIRRKHNYIRHLVFSIHIHSFIFIVMTLVVAMYIAIDIKLNGVTTLFIFSVPVYIIIAVKRFYRQSAGKVILKFFAVSFLYNIVFFIVVVYATLNAINIL